MKIKKSFITKVKYNVDLNTINECTKGVFNYDSVDINKRSKIPIVWQKVDVVKAVEQMKCDAARLLTQLHDDPGKLMWFVLRYQIRFILLVKIVTNLTLFIQLLK